MMFMNRVGICIVKVPVIYTVMIVFKLNYNYLRTFEDIMTKVAIEKYLYIMISSKNYSFINVEQRPKMRIYIMRCCNHVQL